MDWSVWRPLSGRKSRRDGSRRCLGSITAVALALPAVGLAEEGAERWIVTASLEGKVYEADCRFHVAREGLTGDCTDAMTGVHRLTRGRVIGETIGWTFEIRRLLIRVDVSYSGTVRGDHMQGTMEAAGRRGAFTARRAAW